MESDGLEATLEGLCDAGIYVSIAEFRGDAPIERNGLSFTVRDTDFDNPLTPGTWSTSTGGSRSLGRRSSSTPRISSRAGFTARSS